MMMIEPPSSDLPDGEMMEVVVPAHAALPPHQMSFGDTSSGGEDPEHDRLLAVARATKKRADAWAADETRALIGLRREIDAIFNTSKSNKHLWERISAKMRAKGYDRSPTMCTDKWRNLLKEFKKARHWESGKVSFQKEIEELIRERDSNSGGSASTELPTSVAAVCPIPPSQVVPPKVDGLIQFSDKGFGNAIIQFAPVEGSGHSTVNLERQLDHEADPLGDITAVETVAAGGVPPWNWRDPTGEDDTSFSGKVISVKLGEYTRRIGIDGTADAIKDSIKSAFRLRTRRAFWLEDENQVIRSIHRDMPCGDYTLHLDEGVTVKVCVCDESGPIPVHTEEKRFYTQDHFRDFLARRGWVGLREVNGYQSVDSIDDLQSGAIYEGVRLLA